MGHVWRLVSCISDGSTLASRLEFHADIPPIHHPPPPIDTLGREFFPRGLLPEMKDYLPDTITFWLVFRKKDLYLVRAPKLILLQSVDFGADFRHEIRRISWNLADFMPESFKSDNLKTSLSTEDGGAMSFELCEICRNSWNLPDFSEICQISWNPPNFSEICWISDFSVTKDHLPGIDNAYVLFVGDNYRYYHKISSLNFQKESSNVP